MAPLDGPNAMGAIDPEALKLVEGDEEVIVESSVWYRFPDRKIWKMAVPIAMGSSPGRKESIHTNALFHMSNISRNHPERFNVTQNSHILALPTEIQDLILARLSPTDLASICRVCRSLRTAALPWLYRDIKLESKYEKSSSTDRCRSLDRVVREVEICLLLRTISQAPELGALIRSLEFEWLSIASNTPKDVLGFTSQLAELRWEYYVAQDYVRDCINCFHLASALKLVKDTLVRLHVSYYYEYHGVDNETPIMSGYCSLKPLSQLKYLTIPLYILLGFDWDTATLTIAFEDALPRNLVNLTLGEERCYDGEYSVFDEHDIFRRLVEFVEDRTWEAVTPYLEIFDVNHCPDFWQRGAPYVKGEGGEHIYKGEPEFKNLCKENGLVCNIFKFFW